MTRAIRLGRLGLRGLLAFAALAEGSPVRAAAVIDYDTGQVTDDLSTNELIDPALIVDIQLVGGAATIIPPATTGSFTTRSVTPISFFGWKAVYFDWTGSVGDIDFFFESGPTSTPLTIVASDDPAYAAMALIPDAGDDAATSPSARLRFDLTKTGLLSPAIDRYKLTWSPKSFVKLAYGADAEICSGGTVLHTMNTSVSYSTAHDLVVMASLPIGVSTDLPAQAVRLQPKQI